MLPRSRRPLWGGRAALQRCSPRAHSLQPHSHAAAATLAAAAAPPPPAALWPSTLALLDGLRRRDRTALARSITLGVCRRDRALPRRLFGLGPHQPLLMMLAYPRPLVESSLEAHQRQAELLLDSLLLQPVEYAYAPGGPAPAPPHSAIEPGPDAEGDAATAPPLELPFSADAIPLTFRIGVAGPPGAGAWGGSTTHTPALSARRQSGVLLLLALARQVHAH